MKRKTGCFSVRSTRCPTIHHGRRPASATASKKGAIRLATTTIPLAKRKKRSRTQVFLRHVYDYRYLLMMLIPAVAFFILFNYVPMFGAVIAFKKYDYALGLLGSPWVGLTNFQFLFRSGKLMKLIVNTLGYNLMFIAVGTVAQIALSIILSELGGRVFKKTCQTFMFLPYFISWVSVGAIAYNLLNTRYGFINSVLTSLNMETVNFYGNPSAWPLILVIANTWKGVGYGTVVYLAAIAGIDAEIYEAAQIDGANILQRIFRITIPNLVPTVITLTLLSVGGIFRGNFQMFWNMVGNNSLLYGKTDVIDTYVYRCLLDGTNFGMTGAAGLLQSVLCLVMILTVNAIVKKIHSESALF